jgi:hypothetical protein
METADRSSTADALVRKKLLAAEMRNDAGSVSEALYKWFERELSR